MQGGYAHGQGASFPWLPETQGHWGAAAKQRGAEHRHIPLASAEAQSPLVLCAHKRETADGCVTDALVGRPSRHKSHEAAATGRRLEWVLTEWPLPLDWAWLTGWSMPRLRALGKDQNRRHCTSVDAESHFFRPRNTLPTHNVPRGQRHSPQSNSLVEN